MQSFSDHGPVVRIDAHHHFWQYDPDAFGWIVPGSVLARDYDRRDLRAAMASAHVDAVVSVQARQSDEETRFLLANARSDATIVGVVGWIDLRAPDVAERIADRPSGPLVGYRHVVQDEPDPAFLLGPAFVNGVRAVLGAGLAYDLLVNADQLATVPAFLDRAGPGNVILDHAAKPAIHRKEWHPWADLVTQVAAFPHMFCKLSGLVTEASHASWVPDDIEPYLVHLFDCFGPERLIWGSDWPVCTLAGSYLDTFTLIDRFVDRHCPQAAAAVFGGNAIRAYGLNPTAIPGR